MATLAKQLSFRDVDGLAFASVRGKLDGAIPPAFYTPQQLGPFMELLHLSAGGRIHRLENWFTVNSTTPLMEALRRAEDSWVSPKDHHLGYIRTLRSANIDSQLTSFLMKAKRASREISGLSANVSGQLVAAMAELENNIHEHANAPATGLLVYKAEPSVFEFVAVDRGVGILRSLRRHNAYANLTDEGKALEFALTDGISRHGSASNRGHGFRPIFTGLVNLYGEIRFRSGDHAIMMDGTNPELATAQISQKAPIDGFFASVSCQMGQK